MLVNAASQAYQPSLVGPGQLTEANAKLATSGSVTRVAGPALAGTLVQALTGPTAILVDACSFLISAVCLVLIRVQEPPARLAASRRGVAAEMHEGLYLVLVHRLIRPIVLAIGLYNFFAAIFVAVYTLFIVRELNLQPAALGAIMATGGVGGVLGGLLGEVLGLRATLAIGGLGTVVAAVTLFRSQLWRETTQPEVRNAGAEPIDFHPGEPLSRSTATMWRFVHVALAHGRVE